MVFFAHKTCPICCSVCSASQEIRVTRFAQPTINPLACCICWAGLLGRAVFPPWNKGPNFGSYTQVLLGWGLMWGPPGTFSPDCPECLTPEAHASGESLSSSVVLLDRELGKLRCLGATSLEMALLSIVIARLSLSPGFLWTFSKLF